MAVKADRLDLLRWHLDFINLDVGELSQGERLKWITEVLYIVAFGVPRLQVHAYLRDKLPSTKKISSDLFIVVGRGRYRTACTF